MNALRKKASLLAAALGLAVAGSANATVTYSGSSGSLAASAAFTDLGGGSLQVVLTNTSLADVVDPPGVLTAVFFDLAGVGALTPVSALLTAGSTVFFGPDGGGNVGGEWAYGNATGGPATRGISSVGFGLTYSGGDPSFGGSNLQGPSAVDGLQYGITSAGDNTASGNAAVTGGFALIKNSVTFVLSGIPVLGDAGLLAGLSHVSFQYGTNLATEPNVPGVPEVPVPIPAALWFVAPALAGVLGFGRKKAQGTTLSA